MSRSLIVHAAGPGVTVQDFGRPGQLAVGLSRGGAADRLAILEGAALLGQDPGFAALELSGTGGSFEASQRIRIALTGAPMPAGANGRPLAWNASHRIEPGERIVIGSAKAGVYGYLHIGGGITTPALMGSRSAHLAAGIGGPILAGAQLPVGDDPGSGTGERALVARGRLAGGTIRILRTAQSDLFAETELARFAATTFTRDPHGNRQGIRLAFDGARFATASQLALLSEAVMPGDVQMTGDGVPFVLMPECQTTGGYPRIATVLPDDLPIVAQAAPGTRLRFRFLSLEEGLAAHKSEAAVLAALRSAVRPLVRDPRDIPDLLGYQLVGGVTAGRDLDQG